MTSEEMTTGSIGATDGERRLYAARSRWWNSTGGGSYSKAVPGVTATSRGINNVKAGDGGCKFRAEWPELDAENFAWMKEHRVDVASGQIMPDPNVASTSCSPETSALRRRPTANTTGLDVVREGGQVARGVGESWVRRNKVWVGVFMVLGYALLSRIFEDMGA